MADSHQREHAAGGNAELAATGLAVGSLADGEYLRRSGAGLVGGSGGPSPRVAPDADDLAVWTCDEAAGALVNAQNPGTYDLAATGSPLYDHGGVYRGAVGIPGTAGNHFFSGAATLRPATTFHLSAWVKPRVLAAGFILCRPYQAAGAWAAPHYSIGLYINGANGAWGFGATIGADGAGVKFQTDVVEPTDYLAADEWQHLAVEVTGAAVRAWRNRRLVATTAAAGNVDWNTGAAPGNTWALGCSGASAAWQPTTILLDDIRIAQVNRAAAWHDEVYSRKLGTWP